MNLGHRGALALVGWYLMVPPMCADHSVPAWCRESTDPVRQWTIREKFDTEKECNAKLSNWRGRTRELMVCGTADEKGCWNELSPLQHRIIIDEVDAKAANCISSDDPRLKVK